MVKPCTWVLNSTQHFWKHDSNFKRKGSYPIQVKLDGHLSTEFNVANGFAYNFKSIVNTLCQSENPFSVISDLLFSAPISNAEVSGTLKRLKSSKFVRLFKWSSIIPVIPVFKRLKVL